MTGLLIILIFRLLNTNTSRNSDHAFKFEGLSQELAERQKKALLIEYQRYLETVENARKTYADWQGNIKVSEMLMTKIQKSHDINEIASTAIQIIGKLTHDDVFINTNLKKLERNNDK